MDIRVVSCWFTRDWWQYLTEGRPGWRRFWCRALGHPNGVVWFRSYGLEPDMHCRDCGEDLG
jgi:hypothetical protein